MVTDPLIEELFKATEREPRDKPTINLETISRLAFKENTLDWKRYERDFVAYKKIKRKYIAFVLYGPEDAQLDVGVCFNNEAHQTFKGEEVDRLYKRLSSK